MLFRSRLGRLLASFSVGRPVLVKALVAIMALGVRLADSIGTHRGASAGLSGIFNLLYWQGVSDELGGRAAFWGWLGRSKTAVKARWA